MPGKQHVFLALFAGVTDALERQSVIAGPCKLVHAWALTAFRTFSTRFLDCDGVTGDRKISRNVPFRSGSDDMQGIVGFDRPDGAERISPSADQRPLSAGHIRCARI